MQHGKSHASNNEIKKKEFYINKIQELLEITTYVHCTQGLFGTFPARILLIHMIAVLTDNNDTMKMTLTSCRREAATICPPL